jgi:hypothetical protein
MNGSDADGIDFPYDDEPTDHTDCFRDESWACQHDDPFCPRSPGSIAAEIVAEHEDGQERRLQDQPLQVRPTTGLRTGPIVAEMPSIEGIRNLALDAVYKADVQDEYDEMIITELERQLAMQKAGTPEARVLMQEHCALTVDLVQFVLWLRKDTDFFDTVVALDDDGRFPKWDEEKFHGVLAQNAIIYTGE